VLLGDDIIDEHETLLADMIRVHDELDASVIALMEVSAEDAQKFGIATVETIPGREDVVRVTDLIEKPAPGTEPSRLAIIGRYVLQPEVFHVLQRTQPGKGGEIQLTDALLELARTGRAGGVVGVVFRGRRFDTGDRLDYIKAIVQLAVERKDLGEPLRAWLKDFTAGF